MSSTRRNRPRKIALIGDKDTGKHCYVRRLIDNKYPRDSWTNKECDVWPYNFRIDENTEVSTEIYIVHGAERGKTSLKKHYENIDGYIVMFDVTNPESYDNVVAWKKDVDNENKLHDLPCILLATKCDVEKDPEVAEQMRNLDILIDALHFRAHFETSSRDNINIHESFESLVREILSNPNARSSSFDRTGSGSQTEENGSSAHLYTSLTTTPTLEANRNIPYEPKEYRLKIVVIGEANAGKSSIIERYVKNSFTYIYKATIGSDIGYKKIFYNRDVLNIQIWDVAGHERFGSLTHLFYRDADACMIVYDVSKYETLNGAVKWKEDFDVKVNYDEENQKPCILVGNKSDLQKDGQLQDETHVKDFCKYHKFTHHVETSAKTNVNITEAFYQLISEIMVQKLGEQGREKRGAQGTIRFDQGRSSNRRSSSPSCC